MSRLLIVASLFALAVPAAFAAPPSGQGQANQSATPTPSQICKEQRNAIGMSAFRELYKPGATPKAAMDECLKAQKSISGIAPKNAAKTCKVEQADPNFAAGHGGKSFAEHYGKNQNDKNQNDKNAFGKCVSSKASEEVTSQQTATLGAAKQCKAMRASARAAFDAAYGTKKNAFGKCVSKLASEQSD